MAGVERVPRHAGDAPAAADPTPNGHPAAAPPGESAEGPERPTPRWRQMFSALRHPQYRRLMSGIMPALFGMQMGMVGFSYTVYTISGSATALGLMGLTWGLPMLLLSLVGGVVADRFPRRTVFMATQATIMASALSCAVLVITGQVALWHLYAAGLVQGISFAFNMPSRTALIGEIVGKDDITNAMALNNAAMNFSRVIGPGLAGFLIAFPPVGVGGLFAIQALGYVFVLWTVFGLTAGRTSASAGQAKRSGTEQMLEGLRFIRNSPTLLTLLGLAFVPIFLGMPYQMLLPVFALGVLDVGPEGMGMMQMANGAGAMVGSLGVAALGAWEHKTTVQLGLGVLFGLALVAFALSGSFLLALPLLVVVGAAASGYMALNGALVMGNTPKELYGRVMSVYMMTFALMPLGSLPAASIADTIGPPLTVAIAGALLAAVVAATAVLVPSYRRIR